MHFNVDDVRISTVRPLIPPAILMEQLPLSEAGEELVASTRRNIEAIMDGRDDRLLVIVGPCSIHDVDAAMEYGRSILDARKRFGKDLEIVMRVYFEKPRTRNGWKGLINDPFLDESFEINKGLHMARKLLVDLNASGVPAACEFLDTITPQFIADTMSWGAIGARTTESQVHRELASGLSMPVGFKNGTDGNVQIAIDAIHSARNAHHFLSVTKQSVAAIVGTRGNPYGHLILRGAGSETNYDSENVARASAALGESGLPGGLMVDCSHGNSRKDHRRQPEVASDLARQVAGGSTRVFGLMIESNIHEGKQALVPGKPLQYGVSVTDACISWPATVPVLEDLAAAVRTRRKA